MRIDMGYTVLARLDGHNMLLYEYRSECCKAPIYTWPDVRCIKCGEHHKYHTIYEPDEWTELIQIMDK